MTTPVFFTRSQDGRPSGLRLDLHRVGRLKLLAAAATAAGFKCTLTLHPVLLCALHPKVPSQHQHTKQNTYHHKGLVQRPKLMVEPAFQSGPAFS